jgi:hypothetical protein
MELNFKVPILTMGYVKKIRRLFSPPHVNSEAFLGHSAGEVKTAGANIQWSQANGFSIRLSFDVGTNQFDIMVDEDLPLVESLEAWQHLDVLFVSRRNTDSPTGIAPKAVQYIVHNVIETADLNDIFT